MLFELPLRRGRQFRRIGLKVKRRPMRLDGDKFKATGRAAIGSHLQSVKATILSSISNILEKLIRKFG
jgi:hypothetical protein